MRTNKKTDMTPFNMRKKPGRQSTLLLPLIWTGAFCATGFGRLTIRKIGMEGLKPPYLVLSMHQGFTDYFITPLALFPNRASYVSDMEGFANYGKRLYSRIGCIPTRRFVGDVSLIHNIRHVVENNRDIMVIFPEARHSNVGTNSPLPESTGKLIKLLKLPVVVQKLNGSYLSSPIWDEKHSRKVPLKIALEKVLDLPEIERLSSKELTEIINRHFAYDEYRWQYDNNIPIEYPARAEGLHKMLYLCPDCGTEYEIESRGHILNCRVCKKQWEMDRFGQLAGTDGAARFIHIPDWYEFQRTEVKKQIECGEYRLKLEVIIDALPNEKGFVRLGYGIFEHNQEGLHLSFISTGEEKHFSSATMHSVHTEYDYRNFGDCIVLSTVDCCYYIHARRGTLPVTKIHLATEELHKVSRVLP